MRDPFQVEKEEEEEKDFPAGKIIALGLIGLVLIAGYFFLTNYLESKNAVLRIRVMDREGNLIENSKIEVMDNSGNLQLKMGRSEYEFLLETGLYYIAVESPGYKKASASIELKQDSVKTIELEKLESIKLEKAELPEQIICPAEEQGIIEIANLTEKIIQAEIEITGFSGLSVSVIPEKIAVPAEGNALASLKIKCGKIGMQREASGTIGIKNRLKEHFTVMVLPAPEIDFPEELKVQADEKGKAVAEIVFQNRARYSTGEMELIIGERDENLEEKGKAFFEIEERVLRKTFSLEANGTKKVFVYIKDVFRPVELVIFFNAPFFEEKKEIKVKVTGEFNG